MDRTYTKNFDHWDTDFEDNKVSGSVDEDSVDSDDGFEVCRSSNSGPQSRTRPQIPAKKTLVNQIEDEMRIYENISEIIGSAQPPINQTVRHDSVMVLQLRAQLELRKQRQEQQSTWAGEQESIEKSKELVADARAKLPLLRPQLPSPPKVSLKVLPPNPEMMRSTTTPKVPQPMRYRLPPIPINQERIIPTPDVKSRYPQKPPSRLDIVNSNLAAEFSSDETDDSEHENEFINNQPMKYQYQGSGYLKSARSTQSLSSFRSFNDSNEYQGSGSMKSADSTQSLSSLRSFNGSNTSVYHTAQNSGVESSEDQVYEVIPHASLTDRPALPIPRRPPPIPSPTNTSANPRPYNSCPRNASQAGSRPLPRIPSNPELVKPVKSWDTIDDDELCKRRSWFHNVGRKEARDLIEKAFLESSTLPPDGYFLVRPPSKVTVDQAWTLVLWYKNKTFNIAVRKRPDSRYALGKVKLGEPSFASLEEMVDFYKQEELILHSGSEYAEVGQTRLTETPPKNNGWST